MSRVRIKQILTNAKEGQEVSVNAWIRSKRANKNIAFLVLNDGSMQADLQVVIDNDKPAFTKLDNVSTGAAVKVTGILVASPGKGQAWEIQGHDLVLYGSAAEGYPLQKKGHSLEFLREIAHLRGRSNAFGAVFRVRNAISDLIHKFFQERDFIWAHTPILTASDCEGAGEMFQVTSLDLKNPPLTDKGDIDYKKDFFGKETHLTVSGQLNGEAMAMSLGDIYTFGPTFRAENSNTTRHLAEFWMVEPEMAFADINDLQDLAEDFLKYVFKNIVDLCPDELAFLHKMFKGNSVESLLKMSKEPFARVTYTEAIDKLLESGKKFDYAVEWGVDLQTEHERYLSEELFKKPVIVTDYPAAIKAFYMKLNSDGKTVAAMDVLAPNIGEIIGGSQREDQYDVLLQKVKDFGLPQEEIQWYLDLRKFGSAPHAGFGLGFERLVQYVTGMANIRDVIPFPRVPQSINF